MEGGGWRVEGGKGGGRREKGKGGKEAEERLIMRPHRKVGCTAYAAGPVTGRHAKVERLKCWSHK